MMEPIFKEDLLRIQKGHKHLMTSLKENCGGTSFLGYLGGAYLD